MEMVINGVSTRKVAKITEELCGTEFSKSTVSELCKRLDPLVKEWNERPLKEAYPFVMVDAMVLKVRKGGQVRPQSALIAIGAVSYTHLYRSSHNCTCIWCQVYTRDGKSNYWSSTRLYAISHSTFGNSSKLSSKFHVVRCKRDASGISHGFLRQHNHGSYRDCRPYCRH